MRNWQKCPCKEWQSLGAEPSLCFQKSSLSKWFWCLSKFESHYNKPMWVRNCWLQLIQIVLAVKGCRNKSAHSESWEPSLHLALDAWTIPGGLVQPSLSLCSLWSGASSCWLILHFKARKLDQPLSFPLHWGSRLAPQVGQPQGNLCRQATLFIEARRKAFVEHSCLILS